MSDVDAVLGRVLADLGADHVDRIAGNRARVEVDGQSFIVEVATRGRMMLRITEATFVTSGPGWPHPLSIGVTHSGRVRRTGMVARVQAGGDRAAALAEVLGTDPTLRDAAMGLDFTRFRIDSADGHLVGRVTLMGASMTRMRVPPTSSYVRLHHDQRDALLATMGALDSVWASFAR